jgi:preprotein translocase subunit YajC
MPKNCEGRENMTSRFKPGDSVRTPHNLFGTVNAVLERQGRTEIDVEVTSIERHMEAELDHADPDAKAHVVAVQQQRDLLAQRYDDTAKHLAQTKAQLAATEHEKSELQLRNDRQARLLSRVNGLKKTPKKSRR